MKLHFEDDLDYQQAAIESVVDLFQGQDINRTEFTVTYRPEDSAQGSFGITESELGIGNRLELLDDEILENLRAIQLRNGLRPSESLTSGDFTVEMETGTGKTYVYLRTIFELNKRYGFTKFVIVVPSVAIKEGVYKTLQITRDHFENLYPIAKGYEYFLYDSNKLGQVRNFTTSPNIQIMVATVGAINKKDVNNLYKDSEKTGGEKPIDLVRATHPIIIVDEPQSVDGSLMFESSSIFEVCRVGRPVADDGPKDIHAASCESDDGLVVALSLGSFAVVERAAVGVCKRGEGCLVEDPFEGLVAAIGAPGGAGLSGLAQDGSEACGSGQRIGVAEPSDISGQRDELCREHGPHSRQALNEGPIRVAVKEGFQVLVDCSNPHLGSQRFFGEFLDQTSTHCGSGNVDHLLASGGNCCGGNGLDIAYGGRDPVELLDDLPFAGDADFFRVCELGQEDKAGLRGWVDQPLKCRKERPQHVAYAGGAACLVGDEVLASRNEQTDIGVDLADRLDCPQVRARSCQLGDNGGILRVGLGLSAAYALSCPVDGETGRVDEPEACFADHGADKRCHAAEHVERNGNVVRAQGFDPLDETGDCGRIVVDGHREDDIGIAVDGAGPMGLLGNVDTDEQLHGHLPGSGCPRQPGIAVVALHSDGSHSLISGRTGRRERVDMPPEPSRAASMMSMPAPLPIRDHRIKQSSGKAGANALLKGKAA